MAGGWTRSRYTRNVSWKRPVSVVVLASLTALPVSGAVCAVLCKSATSRTAMASGHHHGSSHNAEAAARPSVEAQISGVSGHDCSSYDAALLQASTAAADRAAWGVTSISLAATSVPATLNALTDSGPHFEYRAPPGTAPPTTTPFVLRV